MAGEAPEGSGPPPRRRRWPKVPVYETWIDRQIREAIERGEFDDLPGAGKPIPHLGEGGDDWWIKAKLEREGVKPPLPNVLQLRREREEIQRILADVRTETKAREIVEDLNERVREAMRNRGDGPLIVVRTLNVDETIARWRERRNRA